MPERKFIARLDSAENVFHCLGMGVPKCFLFQVPAIISLSNHRVCKQGASEGHKVCKLVVHDLLGPFLSSHLNSKIGK